MLKPVTAEAVDQEQSLDLRHRSDDGIRVRRDLVQAGPRMGDRRLGQGRQPLHRDVDDLGQEIPLNRRIERRRFQRIAHPEQEAGAFPMEIEGRLEVDHHDLRVRHLCSRCGRQAIEGGDEDVAPIRIDRNLDPRHATDLPGVWSRRIDDHTGFDDPVRCFHGGDTLPVEANAGHLGVALDGSARRLRRLDEPHRHAIRIGDAVAAAAGGRGHAVHVQAGHALRRGFRIEPLHFHAQTALQRHVPPKGVDACVAGEEEQVAVLMKVDRLADLVSEPFQETDRFDGELDVRRVRELVAHAAGVPPGGAGGQQLLALDEHDVGDAAASEVVGDTRTHAPAADDHRVRCPFHLVPDGSSPRSCPTGRCA